MGQSSRSFSCILLPPGLKAGWDASSLGHPHQVLWFEGGLVDGRWLRDCFPEMRKPGCPAAFPSVILETWGGIRSPPGVGVSRAPGPVAFADLSHGTCAETRACCSSLLACVPWY